MNILFFFFAQETDDMVTVRSLRFVLIEKLIRLKKKNYSYKKELCLKPLCLFPGFVTKKQ